MPKLTWEEIAKLTASEQSTSNFPDPICKCGLPESLCECDRPTVPEDLH